MTERRWVLPERRKPLTRRQFAELYLKQDGRCQNCGQRLESKGAHEVEIIDEHLQPLWALGTNDLSNRELWCKPCTLPKTASESTQRAKERKIRDKHIGAWSPKAPPIPGSKRSKFKKKLDGSVERRDQ